MSLLILSSIRFALSLKSIKEKHKTTKPMKQEEEPITGLPENAFRELKPGEVYNPLMSPDKKYSEVNAWSVTWGILMAILFSAAAAYLGLKVGQVFEAAIPIAIIAVGVSGAAKRKNALGENVIIQSIGASSGVIVAGAIFTLPALYILQETYPKEITVTFAQVFISSLLGGVLGILFLIPFRKYFVSDMHGKYPSPKQQPPHKCSSPVKRAAARQNHYSWQVSSVVYTTSSWQPSAGGTRISLPAYAASAKCWPRKPSWYSRLIRVLLCSVWVISWD
jgi:hypothetical protein